jgi:hypothetical protein
MKAPDGGERESEIEMVLGNWCEKPGSPVLESRHF